jgi:CHAD domain-containing protein
VFRALGLALQPSPAVPDASTPSERLRAALAEQGRRLLEHDPGTRLGADPEDLHQMRVAARRARAFLRAARPLLDRDWADELRAQLGWLGSALGAARDFDVLVERVRRDIAALEKGRELVAGLERSVEREREKARSAAVAALSEERYFTLLDRLESLKPKLAAEESATLSSLWWDEFQRTRRTFRRLSSDSSDEELHAARIRVKRARYAAELAAPELGHPGERFVDAAKDLQDVLGEHQDSHFAEERIRAWSSGRPRADVPVALLVEQERARRKKARADWPDAWARLKRRGLKAHT